MTSEAESTSVTMAANDAVTSSSVYDGVSTEGSTQQMTQETSSSLPSVFSKLQLESNLLHLQVITGGVSLLSVGIWSIHLSGAGW